MPLTAEIKLLRAKICPRSSLPTPCCVLYGLALHRLCKRLVLLEV